MLEKEIAKGQPIYDNKSEINGMLGNSISKIEQKPQRFLIDKIRFQWSITEKILSLYNLFG